MILRFSLGVIFALGGSLQAWACSCGGWEGGKVSELSKKYILFWGVPTKAVVEPASKSIHPFRVAYDIDVLESFKQTQAKKLTIYSYGVNNGSCGVQLPLGNPQFLVTYKRHEDEIAVDECTPKLPYGPVKKYLKTGVDTYVPNLEKCFSFKGEINTDVEDCKVWNTSKNNWYLYGREDFGYYESLWMERTKENRGQVRPWWKFWGN